MKLIIIKMLFIKFETFIFPENKACFARQYLYRKTPDTWYNMYMYLIMGCFFVGGENGQ